MDSAMWAVLFTGVALMVATIKTAFEDCDGKPNNWRRLFLVFAPIILTAWIWGPWFGWALENVWRVNTGLINDKAPAERVSPPPVPERPSRASDEDQ